MKKYNAAAIKDKPATPPTTPPAMAPALLFELVGLGVVVAECVGDVDDVLEGVDIVEVGVGVDDGVLLIVAALTGVITK
jgi:hypothetical protein